MKTRSLKFEARILRVALGLWITAGVANAQDFQPGEEVPIQVSGFENPALVYTPLDYDVGRKWPLVLHYHGTNGRPTVAIPRTYTQGRGFVIVGMDFTQRGAPSVGQEFYEDEIAAIREVQRMVGAKLNLDSKRLYIGGFSKGGFVTSRLAESFLTDLAGVYILGAGKSPYSRDTRRTQTKAAAYIGIGQMDPNYPWSVQGITHFEGLGYQVTFDAYPGQGHTVPLRDPASDVFAAQSLSFQQWWMVERYRVDLAPLREPVQKWHAGLVALGSNTGISSGARYMALTRAKRMPFYRFLNSTQISDLKDLMAGLETDPEVQKEIIAQKQFYQILEGEMGEFRFERALQVTQDYLKGFQANPDTYHGALMGLAASRLTRQLGNRGGWVNDPATRQEMEDMLAKNPLPEYIETQPMLALVRDTEDAIRLNPEGIIQF